MSDTLDRILADKRAHVARCKAATPLAELDARAAAASPPRGFKAALERARAEHRFGLIAEIKKASPSRGVIRVDFDPPALARAYAAGGASCLSVLTDRPYFAGEDGFLVAARAAVALPVLRKDFMIDPYQVVEARALGADCVLLIMAALDDGAAAEVDAAAAALGMDVLVEVHDRAELDRAARLGAKLVGINNRNLKTLAVDTATATNLAAGLPADILVVAESGLSRHADLVHAAGHGITSFLVGEALMRAVDLTAATRTLLGLAA